MTCLKVGENRHLNDTGFAQSHTVTHWREFVEQNVLLVAELVIGTHEVMCYINIEKSREVRIQIEDILSFLG
jgi:hypothetical protein